MQSSAPYMRTCPPRNCGARRAALETTEAVHPRPVVLAKYAFLVGSASTGAVTAPPVVILELRAELSVHFAEVRVEQEFKNAHGEPVSSF